MRDSMEFDTVPYEETCEQVGPNYNPVKARNEAKRHRIRLEMPAEVSGEFVNVERIQIQ